MKVRMIESVATPTICYRQGQEYELDDGEAQRLIDAGQATDPAGRYTRKPQRQTMDAKPSTPVEDIDLTGSADAGKQQTAGSVEDAAAAAKVKHPAPPTPAAVAPVVVTSDATGTSTPKKGK